MQIAIEEAKASLREGNHGFGAVIVANNEVIARAHDLEESENDSTSHAEINAIRIASKTVGKDLSDCLLVSTHEPCPMCATAIVWSGIREVAFGYSIQDAMKQGRKRIDIQSEEIFSRSGKEIKVKRDLLNEQCRLLYNQDVRKEIKRLRNHSNEDLERYNAESASKRVKWFKDKKDSFDFLTSNTIDSAYQLLLHRFGIGEQEAPIVERDHRRVVFHSQNFCPTLEACKILGFDTRIMCKAYNEQSTDILVKQIDPNLRFDRNYSKLRPYSDYCEEMIILESGKTSSA